MTEESERQRALRVIDKAMRNIITLATTLDIQFVGLLRTPTSLQTYSVTALDMLEMCERAVQEFEVPAGGATLN